MKAEKAYIENHLEGDVKKYAMGRMIRDYYVEGFTYSVDNKEYMLNLIDEYVKTVSDKKSYVEKMEEIKEDILMYDFELSESALNTKMVNHLGDTITLQDIFSRSKKRVKVVDFWASWCPPCIKQIKENKPFKDRLSVENNVEWIYLSIDADKKKWLAKQEELSETLHFRNSYLLVKGNKSSLAKALNVHSIPRYVIFGRDGKMLMYNAPSPANEEAFEQIIDHLQPQQPIQ
ncbi:MAG: TlpA disulfide reductase family protein [Bacteroidota bacterium]